MSLAVNLLDARSLLGSFGTVGIGLVLFAETGLLIGLFLPGDSLLFTAGLFAAAGTAAPVQLSLPAVIAAAAVGAIAGAETGYLLGRQGGPLLLRGRGRPRLQAAADRAGLFLSRYGHGKAIVLARFVPLVRTVLNPLAGHRGRTFRTRSLPIVALVVLFSLSPILLDFARRRRQPSS